MIEKLPGFQRHWDLYIKNEGKRGGIHSHMLPLIEYTVECIHSKNSQSIKNVFDLVETLMIHGDPSLQCAVATSYLEGLLLRDPEEIQFSTFVKYLGKNSVEYCRAWDEFCGVKTEGLSDFSVAIEGRQDGK
ncbi:MAG: hypothetical protein S4CHLAM102_05770 [Chlamydiia bacterium]|nr:hypothetical protein [Chlamydiia bacterium]